MFKFHIGTGVRRIAHVGVVTSLVMIGAATVPTSAGASPGGFGSQFVLNPLQGNAQFASTRGPGYEAAILAGEQALTAGSISANVRSHASPLAWSPLGPQPEQSSAVSTTWGGANSGRVTGLALTPGASPTLYLASAGGGVWSSTNAGASWSTHTDSQPNIAMGSVTVDPTNPSYVFGGTGEANQCLDCFFGDGVMESSNGGQSWTTVNPGGMFTGVNIGSIVVEPGALSIGSTIVLAGTNNGLYVSTNGGVTWASEAGTNWLGTAHDVSSIVLNTKTSPYAIYAYVQGVGIEYSANNGTTWSLSQPLQVAQPGGGDTGTLAIAPATTTAATTLYASIGSFTGYVGFYKSTDGGASWTSLTMCSGGTTTPGTGCVPYFTGDNYAYSGVNNDLNGDQGWYDNALIVDPQNPNVIVAGGITAVESTDGGLNWTNLNGGGFFTVSNILFHPDFHSFAFDSAGNLYFGNDGGIWEMSAANVNPVSGPPVLSYSNLNTNLDITQFYPGMSQSSNASTILAGAQDNGTNLYSAPNTTWAEVLGGDGGGSAIDPNNALNQLAFADGTLYSTTDGWSSAANVNYLTPSAVKPLTLAVNWAPPVSIVPESGGSTIVLGGDGVYLNTSFSNNGAWTGPLGYTGDLAFQGGSDFVSTLAYAPSNPNVIYAGWDDGTIEMSTDGGLTWTTVQPEQYNSTTHAYLMVTHIAVDPSNPYTIDVAQSASGYLGLAYGGVYAGTGANIEQITTTNATPLATVVTGNLAAGVPSSSVVPDGHGGLVVATDIGVFWAQSLNGANTVWTRIGVGLPNVQVMDLVLTAQGTLLAATHGRGVWSIPFSAPTMSSATVCTWIGGPGTSGSDWSVGSNWSTTSGASCTTAGGPPAGAQLIFPSTPANATVTWDTGLQGGGGGKAPTTSYDSVIVEGSGYTFVNANPGTGLTVSPTLTTPCGTDVGLCASNSSSVTFPLDVTVGTPQAFAAATGSTLTVSGAVSGGAALAIGNGSSTGSVTFTGVSPLTGQTTIGGGTFTLTGSEASSVIVADAGATFYDAGVVGGLDANGGTVAIASNATTPSVVTSPSAPFNWGTLNAVIAGTSSSQFSALTVAGGVVALGGMSLNVNDIPIASPTTSYVLLALSGSASATGTFSGLPEDATFVANGKTLQITYPSQYGGSATEAVVLTDVTGGTVPSSPTGANATAANAQATVTWQAPTGNGGSPITSYTVTASGGGGQSCTITAPFGPLSCTVSALSDGTPYTFIVTATNGIGTSSPSSPSNSVTPQAGLPGAPTNVSALSVNGGAQLTWSAPLNDGGSAITGYVVTATDTTTSANSVLDACAGSDVSTATACTAQGLTNGDSYSITIATINAVGTGSPSNAVPVVPAGLATMTGTPVATAGSSQVSVTWAAATPNGSPITGYTAYVAAGGFCQTAQLTCVITGLTPGTPYQVYVDATNGVGTGAPSTASNSVTPYTMPNAPTSVNASAGQTSAILTWVAPVNDGYSTITGYVVTATNTTTNTSISDACPSSDSSVTLGCTVTGLTAGDAYTFSVQAINAAGTGAASSASNSVTPYTTPNAPTSVSASAGQTSAILTWVAPVNDGYSSVTGYVVTATDTTTSTTIPDACPSSDSSVTLGCTVTGLTGGDLYTFSVQAINAAGTGAASSASSSVTPTGPPGAPTSVSASAGQTSAILTWNAPSNDGGSAITGYVVTATNTTTSTTIPDACPSSDSSVTRGCTVTGLTAGDAYTFSVKAKNVIGTGTASTVSNSVTPYTTPNAPTSVSASAGQTSATLTWVAPVNDGYSSVTGYVVTATNTTASTTIPDACPSSDSSASLGCTVTGLTAGDAYSFSVQAINAAGTGAASSASNSVTPYAAVTVVAPAPPSPATPAAPTPPGPLPVTDYGAPVTGVVSCTQSVTVSTTSNGSGLSASVPACALPAGSTVSVYPVTVLTVGAPGVPSNETVTVAGALTWNVPSGTSATPNSPITLTFTDSSITAGDVIYAVESSGLVEIGTATAGTATVSLSAPTTVFVIVTPQPQATLVVTAQNEPFGTPITLQVTGGSGTGAISFQVVAGGTASGCAISGDVLSATSAGTCVVSGTKLGASGYSATTSASVVETFAAVRKLPPSITLGFANNSSSLGAGAQAAIARWLNGTTAGSSVTIYGYAWKNARLARARAIAIEQVVLAHVAVHVRIGINTRARVHAEGVIHR